jgi:hypothetical protein
LLLLADIRGVETGATPSVGNFARDRFKLFHFTTDKCDAGAERSQLMRGATSDAAARARDEPGLPCEQSVANTDWKKAAMAESPTAIDPTPSGAR